MKTYLEFITELNRDTQYEQDRILDKISKSGIDSLTKAEREFLDSISQGKEDEVLRKQQNDGVWEETYWKKGDAIKFRFELDHTEWFDDNQTIVMGNLQINDDKFHGVFNIENDLRQLNWFKFDPDLSGVDFYLKGNPYKGEDTQITMGGKYVNGWTSDEMKEDDTSEEAAKVMYDLYHNDKEEFNGRVHSMLQQQGHFDTYFDDYLDANDIEKFIYEFADSILDDIDLED